MSGETASGLWRTIEIGTVFWTKAIGSRQAGRQAVRVRLHTVDARGSGLAPGAF